MKTVNNFYLTLGAHGLVVLSMEKDTLIEMPTPLVRAYDDGKGRALRSVIACVGDGEELSKFETFNHTLSKVSHTLEPRRKLEITVNPMVISIGEQEDLAIDTGMTIVLAPTQWGKTIFVSRILCPAICAVPGVDQSMINFTSFIEPYEQISFGPSFDDVQVNWCPSHYALLLDIAKFLVSVDQKVMVIDSLRPFVYDASVGGTAAGGMDAFLPVQLTAISNLAALCGKHIIVTLNPMLSIETEDEKAKYFNLRQKLESSVPAVFTGEQLRSMRVALRGMSNQMTESTLISIPNVNLAPKDPKTGVNFAKLPIVIESTTTTENLFAGIIGSL